MRNTHGARYVERLEAAAKAKKALLDQFRPKAAVSDPHFEAREARRKAELQAVREARTSAKAAKKQAAEDARLAGEAALAAEAAAAQDAKRGVRTERKALTKAEAKAKRDARYAARRARR